jgi:regulator of cell morphogenesis and NO signaling
MSNQVTPDTLVREVAAKHPATLRTLEALGIDYCCGGKLPLAEATAERGLPIETVIAVLEAAIVQASGAAPAGEDWQDAPFGALLDHIVEKHHTYMHSEMPRIEYILGVVARVHGPNHGEVLEPLVGLYAALKAELDEHLKKEEEVTFPAIRRLIAGDVDDVVLRTVRELEEEHERAGAALHAMHEVTHEFEMPDDVCNTYRALYDGLQALENDVHRHIHLENNILFPRVRERVKEFAPAA